MRTKEFTEYMSNNGYYIEVSKNKWRVMKQDMMAASVDRHQEQLYAIVRLERSLIRIVEEFAYTPIQSREQIFNLVYPSGFYHTERLLAYENGVYFDVDVKKRNYQGEKVMFTELEMLEMPFNYTFFRVRNVPECKD